MLDGCTCPATGSSWGTPCNQFTGGKNSVWWCPALLGVDETES